MKKLAVPFILILMVALTITTAAVGDSIVGTENICVKSRSCALNVQW